MHTMRFSPARRAAQLHFIKTGSRRDLRSQRPAEKPRLSSYFENRVSDSLRPREHHSATNALVNAPSFSTSTVTVSPGTSQGVFGMPIATPAGVPVVTMSPGSSGKYLLM